MAAKYPISHFTGIDIDKDIFPTRQVHSGDACSAGSNQGITRSLVDLQEMLSFNAWIFWNYRFLMKMIPLIISLFDA